MVSGGFILCRHQTEFLVNELLVKQAIFRVLFTSVRGKLGKIIICQIKNKVVKSEFGDGTFWRIHSLSELKLPSPKYNEMFKIYREVGIAVSIYSHVDGNNDDNLQW